VDLEQAVDAARGGDPAGIEALYRALSGPLLSFLRTQTPSKVDAEDVLGETFVAVIRDLGAFEGGYAAFKGWAYRIATNRAIDLARKGRRRKEQSIEEAEGALSQDDPEEAAAQAAERATIWRAIRTLPEQQRLAISLRLAGDLSTAEVAEVLGKRPNAVKALQHRAMVSLAKILEAYPEHRPGRFSDRRTDADEPNTT